MCSFAGTSEEHPKADLPLTLHCTRFLNPTMVVDQVLSWRCLRSSIPADALHADATMLAQPVGRDP